MTAAIVASDFDHYFPLDLREKPGPFTTWRIRALAGDEAACLRVLDRSRIAARQAPDRVLGNGCGYADAVAIPGAPVMRCGLAAAFATWRRHVVEPAAERVLGSRLAEVINLGGYSCRDIAGRPGRRSQHATANAIDVAGFRLADGRTVTLTRHWSRGDEGRFLREVRDGACGLFSAVLSPEWNAAHRDHFHLDLGRYSACR